MTEIFLITGRTLVSISLMFFLTKLLGKRQLSEISLFGYISGISIGNIAAYIALESDGMWGMGILSLTIWVLITLLLERLTLKSKKLRKYVDSDRRMLIEHGVLLKDAMAKENMTVEELLEQLRDNDVFRIADIENAAIEANGQISVFLKTEHLPLTPAMMGLAVEQEDEPLLLVVDGSAELDTLTRHGIELNWLKKQLAKSDVNIEEVFVAQYVKDKELSLHMLDHKSLVIKLEQESDSDQNIGQQLTSDQLGQLKKSLLQTIALLEQQTKKTI